MKYSLRCPGSVLTAALRILEWDERSISTMFLLTFSTSIPYFTKLFRQLIYEFYIVSTSSLRVCQAARAALKEVRH
ncbi:MAG: hypothetical protein MUO64_12780 [Anaerolineales bacterium]|nr:hypothetical protein [Anaerolineales bacterium]